uniref:ASL1 fusion protein n=1 Tax=Mus musculus TaxID=10090 RepID=C6EQH8_MOUSE|nr:ASL1 fusion protein [Mus musculus]
MMGRCTVIWCLDLLLAEDEGPKQDLSQKLCCFGQESGRLSGAEDVAASEALWLLLVPETAGLCIPHRHPCSLPSEESWSQGGSRWGLRHKPLGLADPCALTRKVAGCLMSFSNVSSFQSEDFFLPTPLTLLYFLGL